MDSSITQEITSPYNPQNVSQEVENISDPYVVNSGDLIEHKSYPGKQLYVKVTGNSVTLFESEEDKLNNKVFATAARTGIIKRYQSRIPKGKQSAEKTKKKLDFSSPDGVSQLTDQLSTLNVSKPYCPPHKMMPHPTRSILYCEYGCELIRKLDG